VVDTVIELRLERLAGSFREERTLTVTKNRLGPSDAGPHELALGGGKLMVLPEPEAWDRAWAGGWWKLPIKRSTVARRWGEAGVDKLVETKAFARFDRSTTLVRASDPVGAPKWARRLGQDNAGDGSTTVFISLQGDGASVRSPLHGDALASAHRLQAVLVERLCTVREPVGLVVLGDLSAILDSALGTALRRVITRTVRWLHELGVPVVMYETAPVRFRPHVRHLTSVPAYLPMDGTSLTPRYGETVIFELIPFAANSGEEIHSAQNSVLVSDLTSGAQFVLPPPTPPSPAPASSA